MFCNKWNLIGSNLKKKKSGRKGKGGRKMVEEDRGGVSKKRKKKIIHIWMIMIDNMHGKLKRVHVFQFQISV